MTLNEIIELVELETGITLAEMKANKRNENLEAKYVAITIMCEEGYRPPQIAKFFGLHRAAIHNAIKSIDSLLTTYKPFKTMYLACIKRIADNEYNNDIEVYATAS